MLSMRRSKKTSKLRVNSLCEGNPLVTGQFPSQRANNAGNVSILWHYHDMVHFLGYTLFLYHMDNRYPWPQVVPAFRLLHRRTQTSHKILKCGTNKCSHGGIYWTEILRHWAVTNSMLAPLTFQEVHDLDSGWKLIPYTTTAIYD